MESFPVLPWFNHVVFSHFWPLGWLSFWPRCWLGPVLVLTYRILTLHSTSLTTCWTSTLNGHFNELPSMGSDRWTLLTSWLDLVRHAVYSRVPPKYPPESATLRCHNCHRTISELLNLSIFKKRLCGKKVQYHYAVQCPGHILWNTKWPKTARWRLCTYPENSLSPHVFSCPLPNLAAVQHQWDSTESSTRPNQPSTRPAWIITRFGVNRNSETNLSMDRVTPDVRHSLSIQSKSLGLIDWKILNYSGVIPGLGLSRQQGCQECNQ